MEVLTPWGKHHVLVAHAPQINIGVEPYVRWWAGICLGVRTWHPKVSASTRDRQFHCCRKMTTNPQQIFIFPKIPIFNQHRFGDSSCDTPKCPGFHCQH